MALDIPSMRARLPITLGLLQPALAGAQTASPSQDLGGSIIQLLLGLAIVLALLFASLWLLKRLSAPRGDAAGLMRVVAGTAVGTRERVVVIEVGTTWLVVGVAPGRVSALAEIPRASLPPETDPPQPRDFAGRLKQLLARGNNAR
jgi:flagellar protein FliO/FliZ